MNEMVQVREVVSLNNQYDLAIKMLDHHNSLAPWEKDYISRITQPEMQVIYKEKIEINDFKELVEQFLSTYSDSAYEGKIKTILVQLLKYFSGNIAAFEEHIDYCVERLYQVCTTKNSSL